MRAYRIQTVYRSATWRFGTTALAIALFASPGRTQGAPPRATAVRDTLVKTHHQIVVGRRVLKYTALAGTLPIIDNDAGEVHARMFFVAYTLDGPRPRNRP